MSEAVHPPNALRSKACIRASKHTITARQDEAWLPRASSNYHRPDLCETTVSQKSSPTDKNVQVDGRIGDGVDVLKGERGGEPNSNNFSRHLPLGEDDSTLLLNRWVYETENVNLTFTERLEKSKWEAGTGSRL